MKATTTTTTTRKPATKPASKPAKGAQKAQVSQKAQGDTPIKAQATKPASAVFSLVAGTIAQTMHKGLRQAIAYHVSKGNLAKVDAGIQLTAQGAMLWTKERVDIDPARFHEVAAFVQGGECPKEWKGQPVTSNAAGTMKGAMLQLPNVLYWGSFASSDMRRAFAALWATKK